MLNPKILAAFKGQRTRINPAIFQQHLESASNAGAKGQAQWHTPGPVAEALATALPVFRPCLVDLTCGIGSLLCHAAGNSTNYLLGCDIEPLAESCHSSLVTRHFINADVTRLYPMLHAVKWQADLFVLNPPWDLHWYRKNLELLKVSDCLAVQRAFAAHDGRTTRDTIDSTVAALCLALDRCPPWGEGFLIANDATLERLIFAPNAPHGALAAHVWARMAIPGNICEPSTFNSPPSTNFKTGVIYFARSHTRGIRPGLSFTFAPAEVTLAVLQRTCQSLQSSRASYRTGATIKPWEGLHSTNTAELWQAAGEEWARSQPSTAADHRLNSQLSTRWNIYLDVDGSLKTDLSLFQKAAGQVPKSEADRLFELNGCHPMQLVVQRKDRKALEEAVFGKQGQPSPWRVAPAVIEAVQNAIKEYDAVRAPLVPLSKIQRIGYLDEKDVITCTKTLKVAGRIYLEGDVLPIRTETLRVKRDGKKLNNEGSLDRVEYDSSELAIWLGPPGHEALVMEARMKNDPKVKLSIQNEGAPNPVTFTLQQFVDHFAIPEVPDVATLNPAAYEKYLGLLDQIEQIANT